MKPKKFTLLIVVLFGSICIRGQIINIPADYPTIQQGINAANNGDTVLVQPGTYFENIYIGFRNITLTSMYMFTNDTSYISQTIIDGDQSGNVIQALIAFGEINGFTIQNGNGSNDPNCENGGGICFLQAPHLGKQILRNLIIKNNSSDNDGAGIYCRGDSNDPDTLIIENVQIHDNYSEWGERGIGLYCENAVPILTNVTISNHQGVVEGAGAYFKNCDPIITNTTIESNSAQNIGWGSYGGGIYFEDSNPILQNVVISDNFPDGIYCDNSNINVINTTIADNSGEGIRSASSLDIVNSIIWGNESYNNIQISGYEISISNTDIENGVNGIYFGGGNLYWLEGNINQDPLFLGDSSHPYQLQPGSPCIDAGTPDTTGLNLYDYDLIGNVRIFDGDGDGDTIVDMGPYEFGSIPVGLPKQSTDINANSFEIEVYPNPFNDLINLNFMLTQPCIVSIIIYDMAGSQVEHLIHEYTTEGSYKLSLSTNNLPQGVYIVTLQTRYGKTAKRISKN